MELQQASASHRWGTPPLRNRLDGKGTVGQCTEIITQLLCRDPNGTVRPEFGSTWQLRTQITLIF